MKKDTAFPLGKMSILRECHENDTKHELHGQYQTILQK